MTEEPGIYKKLKSRYGGVTRFFSRDIVKDIYDNGKVIIIEQSNKKGKETMAEKKKRETTKIQKMSKDQLEKLDAAIVKGGKASDIASMFVPPIYVTELKNYIFDKQNTDRKFYDVTFEVKKGYTKAVDITWSEKFGFRGIKANMPIEIPDGTKFDIETEKDKKGNITVTLTSK